MATGGRRPHPLRPAAAFFHRVASPVAGLALGLAAAAHGEAAPGLTLEPTRTLDLTLSEGTWMQPDVSPDGRVVVFNILGDIYALDAAGGAARPVLTGMAFETDPVFSPDGKSIAFVSDRSGYTNLWVADADGSHPRQLSHETQLTIFTSPAWSPDGRSVFISRMKHPVLAFELWRYDVGGGAGAPIVRAQPNGEGWDARINALGAVISPDGRYAYYARKIGTTWTERDPPNWSIARRDLKTGADDVIVAGAGGAMHPALSHNGRYLAYASRFGGQDGLRLRDLQTGGDRWLAYPVDHDGQEQGYYADLTPRLVFAADDRSLVTSVGGKLGRIDVATGSWTPIPFSAAVKVALGPLTRVRQREETGPVRARVIQAPRVSPDGRALAFTALGGLYVQDLRAGGPPKRVAGAPAHAFQPRWSPDGRGLVFVTWTSADGGAIWTIPASGGKAARLTDEVSYYTEPTFSPDGRSILALRASHYDRLRAETEISPDRATDIVRLPAAGGGPVSLVAHAFGARLLELGTEPERVRFYGPGGLSSVRLDGEDLRRELTVTALAWSQYVDEEMPAEEVRLDPAGDLALVRAASELYLVRVPAADGGVARVDLENPATDVVKLTRIGADFFDWADGGRAIVWSLGDVVHRVALADIDRASPGATEAKAAAFEARVEVPRDVPAGTVVLRGATVATLRGDEVIRGADIVVKDNRIAAVGRTGEVAVPDGATIRDVSGKFITPGFVDAHAHWFEIRRGVQDDQPWPFLANLAFGVTSGLDPQSFTNDVFVYHDMIDAGLMLGPRTYSTGPGVFHSSHIDSEADAEAVLTRYRDAYGTRNIKAYMVGDRARRQYLVEAAKALGMMPTTEGASDLDLNLTHAIDGFSGNEHSLPVAPLHRDIVELFAQSRTSLVPTLSVLYGGEPPFHDLIITRRPQDDAKVRRFIPPAVIHEKLRNQRWTPPEWQSYARFARNALDIQRAGGVVGLGSHGIVQGAAFPWEMELFAAGGATPMETLRAATMGSAEAIGHADEIGSLEPGKFADLLIFDADPLADIANVEKLDLVMKNGRLYRAVDLAEVWPRPRPGPTTWFRNAPTPANGTPDTPEP